MGPLVTVLVSLRGANFVNRSQFCLKSYWWLRQIGAVPHTLEQLRYGIVDFCCVLDQAFTGFMWNWVYLPKFSAVNIKPDNGVMGLDEVMGRVKNATIESSLISLRVLDEFFGDTGVRPGDIRSHHYDGYSSP